MDREAKVDDEGGGKDDEKGPYTVCGLSLRRVVGPVALLLCAVAFIPPTIVYGTSTDFTWQLGFFLGLVLVFAFLFVGWLIGGQVCDSFVGDDLPPRELCAC
jgi:hypothetical protein